jgi:hypothetical protein
VSGVSLGVRMIRKDLVIDKRIKIYGKVKEFHLIFIVIKGKICYNIVERELKGGMPVYMWLFK